MNPLVALKGAVFAFASLLFGVLALSRAYEATVPDLGLMLVLLAVFFVGALLLEKTNGLSDFRRPSLPAIWFTAYSVLIFLPSLAQFLDRPAPHKYTFILCVASALLTVPFGVAIALAFKPYQSPHGSAFFDRPVQEVVSEGRRRTTYVLLLSLALLLTAGWLFEQSTPIPLVALLRGGTTAGELAWLRDYSFKLLDSPFRYFYHLTRDLLFPFLVMVSIGSYLQTRSKFWLISSALTTVVALVFSTANLARSPAMVLLLLLGFFVYLLQGATLRFRTAISYFGASVVFPIAVVALREGLHGIDAWHGALVTTYERIFVAPSAILYYFFEVVPAQVPYLHGLGMGSLVTLFGLNYFDLGNYIGAYVVGEGGSGYTSATAAFVAGFYTDFGPPGVIVGGILVGIAMQSVQTNLANGRKTVAAVAMYSFSSFTFASLVYLQAPGALILSGFPFLWLLFKSKALG